MPVLPNTKHERFAQAVAKGVAATEAYISVGYKEDKGNASKLLSNKKVQQRVQEITTSAAARTEASVERVLKELSRLGFSDLRRAFDGNRLKSPEEWDDDFAASVASVEVVTRNLGDGEVEHVHKIKVWDKNSALEKIAKHLQMFVERSEVNVTMSLEAMIVQSYVISEGK